MKKYILILVVAFFTLMPISVKADCPPPPQPDGECDCGNFMVWNDESCEYESSPEYVACLEAAGCLAVPIDSHTLILFALAISFGTYSIYRTNKKRRFEN